MRENKIYSQSEASRFHENDSVENTSVIEVRCVIETQRKNIEKFKRIATKILQTMKNKEEDSKRMVTYFTSQLQEMDKTCKH